MPIKNLSEIKRLNRVGKIHLGVKAKSSRGSEYPKAVDYFVVKADESTPQTAVDAFKKVYGDNPKELKIMFPVNSVRSFWDYYYKSYVRVADGSGKLICKGDGEKAERLNYETGEILEIDCPTPEECPYAVDKRGNRTQCRKIGSLQFILPDLEILGVWQIDTSSFNGIVSLNGGIEIVRTLTGGRIAGIPLYLKIVPRKALVAGKQNTIHHLIVEFRSENPVKTLTDYGKSFGPQYEIPQINHDEVPTHHFPQAVNNQALPAPEEPKKEMSVDEEMKQHNYLMAIKEIFSEKKFAQAKQDAMLKAYADDLERLYNELKDGKVG